MTIKKIAAKRVQELRLEKGMTVSELAEACELSIEAIKKSSVESPIFALIHWLHYAAHLT